jgi:hypothetical protein
MDKDPFSKCLDILNADKKKNYIKGDLDKDPFS